MPAFSTLFRVEPTLRERQNSDLHLRLGKDELSSILSLLESIAVHSNADGIENKIIASGEAIIAITKLCSFYEKSSVGRKDVEDADFLRSVEHIYEKYDQKIEIADLAAIAKMSRSEYIQKFGRAMGSTPGNFLTERRVAAAKTLLSETAKTVQEIAQAVGFYDASHFARVFQRRTGVSPAVYRKRNEKS